MPTSSTNRRRSRVASAIHRLAVDGWIPRSSVQISSKLARPTAFATPGAVRSTSAAPTSRRFSPTSPRLSRTLSIAATPFARSHSREFFLIAWMLASIAGASGRRFAGFLGVLMAPDASERASSLGK